MKKIEYMILYDFFNQFFKKNEWVSFNQLQPEVEYHHHISDFSIILIQFLSTGILSFFISRDFLFSIITALIFTIFGFIKCLYEFIKINK